MYVEMDYATQFHVGKQCGRTLLTMLRIVQNGRAPQPAR